MNERGMIFNAEMVRAILEGRKTQTRRPVKPQPELTERSGFSWNGAVFGSGSDDRETNRNFAHVKCPFGKPGYRIWVRETFRVHSRATDVATLVYRASVRNSWTEQTHRVPVAVCNKPAIPEKWTPSIHMPRWASRITLEITDVRVERLHNISERDALREGLFQLPASGRYCLQPGMQYFGMASSSAKEVYSWLWASIYGEESWAANPWVWVIEFKRVEGGAA
ncbi:hypothetical protein CS183_07265 [Salmonella enterica]|uniref:Morphogenetic protein n=2 Tax=Salmonella enterica TaxID=28901 RepID=A0A757H3F6_SALER|nr:hypothetical protein [Salmonella enterica]EBY5611317.1 hypothetical protein [Salmonella enterica subsp. enterica serovar Chicago]ECS4134555.1 hypothetical protein [Salmonella enterica subsp. enterica serovar Nima]EDU8803162.1 hypothetical protein [Salmonella enterica subsp. enterica]EDX3686416.1 hypothetical protein [Salmonella enterica subsp. enterica serovar Urbana]EKE6649401.1 hypothetical protein [Salmonella enterica subsp. enterica serovar Bredeney]HCB4987814.1 hypothetical protein [S